jgi:hypothetical protein
MTRNGGCSNVSTLIWRVHSLNRPPDCHVISMNIHERTRPPKTKSSESIFTNI